MIIIQRGEKQGRKKGQSEWSRGEGRVGSMGRGQQKGQGSKTIQENRFRLDTKENYGFNAK